MKKIKIVLTYGFIWGILEATLGPILKAVAFPFAGYIMMGIGASILATVVIKHHNPYIMPLIGFVAATVKLLDLFIYPYALWYKVFRPAAAIIMESLLFCLVSIPILTWYISSQVKSTQARPHS